MVYLALDPQLQREVAIKALRGSASTADALLNEARAVGRLSHPGIVPVFEVGEASPAQHNATSGGRTGAYLVFEYVAGPTLADVLKEQGALAPALAVRMLLPALEAVAYAHSRDVIHRDLKPPCMVPNNLSRPTPRIWLASRMRWAAQHSWVPLLTWRPNMHRMAAPARKWTFFLQA